MVKERRWEEPLLSKLKDFFYLHIFQMYFRIVKPLPQKLTVILRNIY